MFMTEIQDQPIDDILKSIREAITGKERKEYFHSFYESGKRTEQSENVFVLSKSMLVKREDIPYRLGVWNFDDVAQKIMKKYRLYFNSQLKNNNEDRVKIEEADALPKVSFLR